MRPGPRLLAVLLFAACQGPPFGAAVAAEIWLGSNLGAHDLAAFAVDPDVWPALHAVTKVFTFYGQAITAEDRSECVACEDNVFPALRDRGVFTELHRRRIGINIETGSVKDWDCDGTQNVSVAIRILDRFRSIGVPISHLSMDEPFMAGKVWCRQPASFTAERVANFMSVVTRQWHEAFPDVPVSIGLLEPYPRHDMSEIIEFVRLLIANGQRPNYFHLDVNKLEMPGRAFDEEKIRSDFRRLAQFMECERIPWGTFFASFAGATREEYRADFLDTVASIRRWYGPTRHLVFQSWERTSEDGGLVNRRPHNTPEGDAYSLTGLAQDALKILGRK